MRVQNATHKILNKKSYSSHIVSSLKNNVVRRYYEYIAKLF